MFKPFYVFREYYIPYWKSGIRNPLSPYDIGLTSQGGRIAGPIHHNVVDCTAYKERNPSIKVGAFQYFILETRNSIPPNNKFLCFREQVI